MGGGNNHDNLKYNRSMDNIETNFVRKMASVLELDPGALTDATPLGDETWDSLTLVNAIGAIDECYGVTVDTRSLAKCRNLGEVISLVRDKVQHP